MEKLNIRLSEELSFYLWRIPVQLPLQYSAPEVVSKKKSLPGAFKWRRNIYHAALNIVETSTSQIRKWSRNVKQSRQSKGTMFSHLTTRLFTLMDFFSKIQPNFVLKGFLRFSYQLPENLHSWTVKSVQICNLFALNVFPQKYWAREDQGREGGGSCCCHFCSLRKDIETFQFM